MKAESQHIATSSKPVIQQAPINFVEGYAQNMTRTNDPQAWLQQYYQKPADKNNFNVPSMEQPVSVGVTNTCLIPSYQNPQNYQLQTPRHPITANMGHKIQQNRPMRSNTPANSNTAIVSNMPIRPSISNKQFRPHSPNPMVPQNFNAHLPNNSPVSVSPQVTPPKTVVHNTTPQMGATQVVKHSSNFDLLTDLSKIPQLVSPGPTKPVNVKQNNTQSILQQVNQISKNKSFTKIKPLSQNYINSIFTTALPTDQLRCKNKTHAAARCCPAKNRQNGALPFDENRLQLKNVSNDYINCSRIATGSPVMPFALVGESPLPSYNEDIWRVVWDENVETLIFICSQEELSDPNLTTWHPKGGTVSYPQAGISLESKLGSSTQDFNQFTIILTRNNQKRSMTVFEICDWNQHQSYSPQKLASRISVVSQRFLEQKSHNYPPYILSTSGGGRCGTLLFLMALVLTGQNTESSNALEIYSHLQNSRNLLMQSRLAHPG